MAFNEVIKGEFMGREAAFAEIRHSGENARAEARANAMLVTALPDLLNATKLLLAIIKDALADDNLDASTDAGAILCGDACADAVFAAQDAIAKAGAAQAVSEAA